MAKKQIFRPALKVVILVTFLHLLAAVLGWLFPSEEWAVTGQHVILGNVLFLKISISLVFATEGLF